MDSMYIERWTIPYPFMSILSHASPPSLTSNLCAARKNVLPSGANPSKSLASTFSCPTPGRLVDDGRSCPWPFNRAGPLRYSVARSDERLWQVEDSRTCLIHSDAGKSGFSQTIGTGFLHSTSASTVKIDTCSCCNACCLYTYEILA